MSSYSLGGYLAALQIRGGRNLLVEGPTDSKVVARAVREVESVSSEPFLPIVVDTADLICDPELPPGMRERVEHIYRVATDEALPIAALVDREFREFVVDNVIEDALGTHYRDGQLYWTRGHSIENYLMDPRYVLSYLRMKHPEAVSATCDRRVRDEFPNILLNAAAASLAARTCGVLERCGGACREKFWAFSVVTGADFSLDEFLRTFEDRGIPTSTVREFEKKFRVFHDRLKQVSDTALVRWIAHGHIVWDFVWAGVAGLLRSCGAGEDVVRGVCRGFFEEKIRFIADCWVRDVFAGDSDSPDGLWEWMSEAA